MLANVLENLPDDFSFSTACEDAVEGKKTIDNERRLFMFIQQKFINISLMPTRHAMLEKNSSAIKL